MNRKPTKIITSKRVLELLDCYGANSDHWPEDECTAALAMIHNKQELQRKFLDAQVLDMAMGAGQPIDRSNRGADQWIIDKIIKQLPEQDALNVEYTGRKNKSGYTKQAWFSLGIAATFAAIVISSAVIFRHSDIVQPVTVSGTSLVAHSRLQTQQYQTLESELDQWLWQEVIGEETDDFEEQLTMMSLVEMES